MAVPSQFAVYHDSNVFRLRCLFQLLAVDKVGGMYELTFMGSPDVFSFVWVKQHLPALFLFLKMIKVRLHHENTPI